MKTATASIATLPADAVASRVTDSKINKIIALGDLSCSIREQKRANALAVTTDVNELAAEVADPRSWSALDAVVSNPNTPAEVLISLIGYAGIEGHVYSMEMLAYVMLHPNTPVEWLAWGVQHSDDAEMGIDGEITLKMAVSENPAVTGELAEILGVSTR